MDDFGFIGVAIAPAHQAFIVTQNENAAILPRPLSFQPIAILT